MSPKKYDVAILRAIDGDTFDISVDLGWNISIKTRIRIKGINCKELHAKDAKDRLAAEKAKAKAASFEGKAAVIDAYGYDKYGRRVVDLLIENYDYSKMMISEKLADEYICQIDGIDDKSWA